MRDAVLATTHHSFAAPTRVVVDDDPTKRFVRHWTHCGAAHCCWGRVRPLSRQRRPALLVAAAVVLVVDAWRVARNLRNWTRVLVADLAVVVAVVAVLVEMVVLVSWAVAPRTMRSSSSES